jgi:HlyD family secretion protein
MTVTAEIETRYRSNVLTVPIASVTSRLPKEKEKKDLKMAALDDSPAKNSTSGKTNSTASSSGGTNSSPSNGTNSTASDKKSKEPPKPIEVVFSVNGERAKMVPVKIGISDDTYWEITEGLKEGDEIVSGGFRAISRDLEEGKKVKKGPPPGEKDKEKEEKTN